VPRVQPFRNECDSLLQRCLAQRVEDSPNVREGRGGGGARESTVFELATRLKRHEAAAKRAESEVPQIVPLFSEQLGGCSPGGKEAGERRHPVDLIEQGDRTRFGFIRDGDELDLRTNRTGTSGAPAGGEEGLDILLEGAEREDGHGKTVQSDRRARASAK